MSAAAAHGLLAAFGSPEALKAAVEHVRERGYSSIDAFTPFPVEGLAELTGAKPSKIRVYAFIGGAVLSVGIFALQSYSVLVNYPIDVGGRPLFSWPAFLIPAFECAILGAALTAFVGMLAGNGLPRLYHPVFNAPSYSMARGDRFYLLIGSDDPNYDPKTLRELLQPCEALSIDEVAP